MTVGDRIKELRRDNGLTQKELANAMGVTASMIGQYETGIRTPNYEPLERLAKALSVSVPMLMGEDTTVDICLIAINLSEKYGLSTGDAENIVNDCIHSLKPLFRGEDGARFNALLSYLNAEGRKVAYERVRELTEIPRYQKQPVQEE